MAIPSVVQGLIKTEGGKVFKFESSKGSAWLESASSLRYEPTGANKPYTVRKEAGKGGDYWYGYRKVAGKLHKKYIGKTSELSTAKLEEIAEAVNTSPQPRVTDRVTEVAVMVKDKRLSTLEAQIEALQDAVKALQDELLGKSDGLSDSSEVLKLDTAVTDNQLHTDLGNLRAENELLKADYAKLLESSPEDLEFLKRLFAKKDSLIPSDLWQEIEKLKERNRQVHLKIGAERRESIEKISELEHRVENLIGRNQEKQVKLDEFAVTDDELQIKIGNLKSANETLKADYAELLESSTHITNELREEVQRLRSQLETEGASRKDIEAELFELKQNSAPTATLLEKLTPDAATILSQLRAKRKKSPVLLADIEAILEIVES
jgi:chromosome segregation ATPase